MNSINKKIKLFYYKKDELDMIERLIFPDLTWFEVIQL